MSSNEKKCEEMMNTFYMLDKDERIPAKVSLHLLCCKECRTKVRMLTKAEKLAAGEFKKVSATDTEDVIDIINTANPYWMNKIKPVSMTNWVVSGIIVFTLFMIFGFYVQINNFDRLYIANQIAFGVSVCLYLGIFVAVNMDFFVKRINRVKLA